MTRDPRINDHTPQRLRWFADRFREMAIQHRKDADRLEAKAKRYDTKADRI